MQSCVAIAVETAFLDDVVMGLLGGVEDVGVGTASGLVALDEHSVVGCVGDVDTVEMPVGATESHPLIWVVGVLVIGHGAEVEHGAVEDEAGGGNAVEDVGGGSVAGTDAVGAPVGLEAVKDEDAGADAGCL